MQGLNETTAFAYQEHTREKTFQPSKGKSQDQRWHGTGHTSAYALQRREPVAFICDIKGMFHDHAKISDLNSCRNTIYQSINKLSVWSKESTLTFNNDKTKVMILSTRQMSRVHHLQEYDPNISVSGYNLERIKSCKLLGVHINEHLKCNDRIKHMVSACNATLSILRKLKYLAKYELRKAASRNTDFVKTRLCRSGFLPSTTILTSPFATGSICCCKFCTPSLR